ncbi:hypothetical protein QYE76_056286 [Lolium multiflorum]|uniref:Uncharacterized protein n=1 Tax=Lolium multiflorum TaxID=4521 RepID=A0AAD8T1B6_LOLMU|nr:hypothetical protein QYE76_056286 [Lolium multiflorum]
MSSVTTSLDALDDGLVDGLVLHRLVCLPTVRSTSGLPSRMDMAIAMSRSPSGDLVVHGRQARRPQPWASSGSSPAMSARRFSARRRAAPLPRLLLPPAGMRRAPPPLLRHCRRHPRVWASPLLLRLAFGGQRAPMQRRRRSGRSLMSSLHWSVPASARRAPMPFKAIFRPARRASAVRDASGPRRRLAFVVSACRRPWDGNDLGRRTPYRARRTNWALGAPLVPRPKLLWGTKNFDEQKAVEEHEVELAVEEHEVELAVEELEVVQQPATALDVAQQPAATLKLLTKLIPTLNFCATIYR